MFNVKDSVQNDNMRGDDDICNFGNCELCGAVYRSCACYEHAEPIDEGWLEAQLESLLDDDISFRNLPNASTNGGSQYSVCNSGSPLCSRSAPLGTGTDGTAAHPVPNVECDDVGRLYSSDSACSVNADRDQCNGMPMRGTEPAVDQNVWCSVDHCGQRVCKKNRGH